MYLKSIHAYGFKSFAEKLNIELDSGITAVVGPNGSGKSNIVDAIRWVLGEQSIKSLRGTDNMTDVIFSGSKTRDALSRASVSLTFDNSDHYLNSEFNEVEIKRMVYKTGENEYFINNNKVRLKDITNLFLDTGAGVDAFNIISQGSVQDIINSKPEARRTIFEEAACVLKYKKRKEESLRKLEKTKDNIEKVSLLIDELAVTVDPLKEQAEIAKVYLDLKEKLKNIEIALLAEEITANNERKIILNAELESLNTELLKLNTNTSSENSEVEKLKLEIMQTEEEVNVKSAKLLSIVEELSKLASEKQIALERQKYTLSDDAIEKNLIKLKENELELKKELDLMINEIESLENEFKEKQDESNSLKDKLLMTKIRRSNLINDINVINKKIYETNSKISILESNLENDNRLPQSVKSILSLKEKGVHNTIGKVIEVSNDYTIALETALGFNANFIIVENELVAKKCISYLKENRGGRATFFPLNVIKGKSVDDYTLNLIKDNSGFVGILSNLVKFDKKYENIITNQLGNVIVAKDIDSLNEIGKLINYKYRVVSLDGEILHSGGSITGGNAKNNYSAIVDKKNLEDLKLELARLESNLTKCENELKEVETEYEKYETESLDSERNVVIFSETISSKKNSLNGLNDRYNNILNELKGLDNIKNNSLNEELLNIIKEYNDKDLEKNLIDKELSKIKEKKELLNNKLNDIEQENRKNNSLLNRIQNDIHSRELELSKINIILDNDLENLSENYSMTYEKAHFEYSLDTNYNDAKKKINDYKREIARLGEVNTGAIAEYERLSTRYEFLFSQREDLEKSCDSLLEVIEEMDKIMVDRFKETYDKINSEFNITFRKLFKGGAGSLRLTDPTDLLKTGIDIVAEPPGKKLNSIGLLSGGEKTLTAIALIFAILNVKTVPFCVFDEVEAALDEANVDMFGEYLQEKKEKSQFILITHKKRTMEYADTLYGITMQESGVSKIVSVKLEN